MLEVSGASEVSVNAQGLRTGTVLDAGSVSMNAALGYVAVRPGAQILARGATDVVDSTATNGAPQPLAVASAGGRVALQATNGLFVDGRVQAQGGNASVPGGSLSVRLVPAYVANEPADVTALRVGPTTVKVWPCVPSGTSWPIARPPAPRVTGSPASPSSG